MDSRIRAVIFDLDGTLIDTLNTYTLALNMALNRYGIEPIERSKLAHFLNMAIPLREILERISPIFLDPKRNEECIKIIHENYSSLEKETVRLLPGVREVLRELKKRKIKIGIVTGRTSKGERKWVELRRLKVDRFVDSFITASESPRKPNAQGLMECIERLGVRPEEVVFVGDSVADMMAGKKANLKTFGVLTGVASEEDLITEKPTGILKNLKELLNYI
ncbi:MAG: HAD family hydrolase [Deltaproteobacteria bacterium]|nr:HAD family hydrolase [Deltaproteobacteria bacterium]